MYVCMYVCTQKPLFKTLNLDSFMGVQAHTAHVHFKVQEAQEAQVYLAIEPAAKWLEFS